MNKRILSKISKLCAKTVKEIAKNMTEDEIFQIKRGNFSLTPYEVEVKCGQLNVIKVNFIQLPIFGKWVWMSPDKSIIIIYIDIKSALNRTEEELSGKVYDDFL